MKYILDKKFNALDRMEKWDEVTQEVIQARIKKEKGAPMRFSFFDEREGEILEIITDALIPQEKDANYIKIAEIIDEGLKDGKRGVCYGNNPWPPEFYKNGIMELSEEAEKRYGKPIEDFSEEKLVEFISKLLENEDNSFLKTFVQKVLMDATVIYYSHPASWNQIGFPGPAYPEGYSNLDCGEKEKWEPGYGPKS